MRIAEGDNTARNWPNLGSQESAIIIRPVSLFASVKCWAEDGSLFRLFKFTDLQPKLGQYRPYTKPIVIFTMTSSSESRRARVGLFTGPCVTFTTANHSGSEKTRVQHSIGPLLCRKCWRPEFGSELSTKCIPELSFQQRHDIGSRSSANFWRCWASVGPYLTSHLGCRKLFNKKNQHLFI